MKEFKDKTLKFIKINKYYLIGGILVVFLLTSVGVYAFKDTIFDLKNYNKISINTTADNQKIKYSTDILGELVMANKPTPPEAALYYAYLSSVYADVYSESSSAEEATIASKGMIQTIYPNDEQVINERIQTSSALKESSQKILDQYIARFGQDKHNQKDETVIPLGEGKWIHRENAPDPFSPSAGSWQRWTVEDGYNFEVQAPITREQPALYQQELLAVQKAVDIRNANDVSQINYWGGTPGTKTPSGIWLDTAATILKDKDIDYTTQVQNQKILTQAMSDSFIEAWKVKYTYWTERPSMVNPELKLQMQDPDFPAYVSGHTTVSFGAATVLSRLYPEHSAEFLNAASNARDSRVNAGVHFPMDNIAGEKLGKDVGNQALVKFELEPIVYDETLSIYPSETEVTKLEESYKSKQAEQSRQKILFGEGKYEPEILNSSKSFADNEVGSLYRITASDAQVEPIYIAVNNTPVLSDGFVGEKINTDRYWSPGACANLPSVVLGDHYIASLEGTPIQAPADSSESFISIYNIKESKFIYLNNTSLQGYQVEGAIDKIDDQTVAIYYKETSQLLKDYWQDANAKKPAKSIGQDAIIKRIINLTDYSYKDYRISIPEVKGDSSYLYIKDSYLIETTNKFLDPNSFVTTTANEYYSLSDVTGRYTKIENPNQYSISNTEIINKNNQQIASYKLRDGLIASFGTKYDSTILINTSLGGFFSTNILIVNENTKEVTQVFQNNYKAAESGFGIGELDSDFYFVHLH